MSHVVRGAEDLVFKRSPRVLMMIKCTNLAW